VIFVKIYGGLGNQLYQYALGRALSVANSTLCKMDLREFESYKLHRYSLGHFNIQEYLMEEDEFRCLDHPQKRRWYRRRGCIPIFHEKDFFYDPKISQLRQTAYLDGYWQSFKYFEGIRAVLLQEITVKYATSGDNAVWLQRIQDCESVALHVRRGDYASEPQTKAVHGLCSGEYYRQAYQKLLESLNRPVFFIFSDDPDWVRDEFHFIQNKHFIAGNPALFNYEDFRLMAACRHQIIANSSFSWWAAWINKNPSKIVHAPRKWFAKEEEGALPDRIPSDWVLL